MNRSLYACFFAFTFSVCFLSSCEFKLNDEYDNRVDRKVTSPDIQIVQLNILYDTLYIYSNKYVQFNFTSSSQAIKKVKAFIDGTEIYSGESNSGSFTVQSFSFLSGVHTLTIKIFTKTGTGSIAEQIDSEFFELYKSWPIVVDNTYQIKVESNVENGLLKLHWAKCKSQDFKDFEVQKSDLDYYHTGFFTTNNDFTDSTYVGEGQTYKIYARFLDGSILIWGNFSFLQKELPRLFYSSNELNQTTIKWNKLKYYGAVDSAILYQDISTINAPPTLVKTTRNYNDTVCTLQNPPFSELFNYRFIIIPRKVKQFSTYNQPTVEVDLSRKAVGYPIRKDITSLMNYNQISNDEIVFMTGFDTLFKYSVTNKLITQKFKMPGFGCSAFLIPIAYSPQRKYMVAKVNCYNNIMVFNTNNLSDRKILNIPNYSELNNPSSLTVSDDGQMNIVSSSGSLYIYDFMNSVMRDYFSLSNHFFTYPEQVSYDGKYMLISGDSLCLIRYSNGTLDTIHSYPYLNNLRYKNFHAFESNKIILWDQSTFCVKSCDNYSTIYSFPLTDSQVFNIDFYNNEFLSSIRGHLLVRSLLTGEILHDIPLSSSSGYSNNFMLINHTIISANGVLYFTN